MLHLAAETDRRWLERALDQVDLILVDHAHCEKKAASTAVQLLFRYGDEPWLLEPLSALAREELEHFEQVLGLLGSRGVAFRRLRPSRYASRLHEAVRREEPARLLDTLLCCALIEARSCERMRLLADALPDPELASFYGSLLACEARHHAVYVDLAVRAAGDRVGVMRRLEALAAHEAAVLGRDEPELRLHS